MMVSGAIWGKTGKTQVLPWFWKSRRRQRRRAAIIGVLSGLGARRRDSGAPDVCFSAVNCKKDIIFSAAQVKLGLSYFALALGFHVSIFAAMNRKSCEMKM